MSYPQASNPVHRRPKPFSSFSMWLWPAAFLPHSLDQSLWHLTRCNQAQLTGSVFLYLKKAIDLVDHTILLQKLAIYLQNPSTVSLLKSFLQDRAWSVFLNGNYSTEGVVKCGVPEASVLGPLLFSLYINDRPQHITNSKVVCDLSADDNSTH